LRLAVALREELEGEGLAKLYEEIDLPLIPVLARMEHCGVKIDTKALAKMSTKLEREADAKAKEIYDVAGTEFNISSPKQLGDVLFNRLNLPTRSNTAKARKFRLRSMCSKALPKIIPSPAWFSTTASSPSSNLLTWTHFRRFSTQQRSPAHYLRPDRNRHRTPFLRQSNLQNIPVRTELGREIRAAFIAEPGHVLLAAITRKSNCACSPLLPRSIAG